MVVINSLKFKFKNFRNKFERIKIINNQSMSKQAEEAKGAPPEKAKPEP